MGGTPVIESVKFDKKPIFKRLVGFCLSIRKRATHRAFFIGEG